MEVIPIIVRENLGIDRTDEPVMVGVPFPRGLVQDIKRLNMRRRNGDTIQLQATILDQWPDLSAKWALVEFFASVKANKTEEYEILYDRCSPDKSMDIIFLSNNKNNLNVDTGVATFKIDTSKFLPFSSVYVGDRKIQGDSDCRVRICDIDGMDYDPIIETIVVETTGPLTATVAVRGGFYSALGVKFCDFISRMTFYLGLSLVKINLTIRNPRAAKHRGGMWDLGDEGSIYFKDISVSLRFGKSKDVYVGWTVSPTSPMQKACSDSFELYQDSSGGENWNSPNHINRFGRGTNAFRGYRIHVNNEIFQEGERASPVINVVQEGIGLCAAVPYFWENFPKALEFRNGDLFIRLFPGQHNGAYELQGGEQKTHTIYLNYETDLRENAAKLHWVHDPLIPVVSPEWVAATEVFPHLVPHWKDSNQDYIALMEEAVEGNHSFFARREIIDEYGWRNFGDLYADHEALNYMGEMPPISHYNNQYDGIYGAILQYMRSGNEKWFRLAAEMGRHVVDIDVYHTDRDKTAYSGGLFWHTDHYSTAATATHRTYSCKTKENNGLATYGGGPSNEHLYTTGLLYYYFITGDVIAKETVIGLAEWVLNMEDGKRTVFRFLCHTPTGFASSTASRIYHGPGRGAGNSINALIDAFVLTKDRKYVSKAENLVRRCIHPKDDIDARDLLNHEARWSYTAFLQVLARFLDLKIELGEMDYMYFYARDSILLYANWILDNEIPFSQCLEKVEYPTETWIVHDLRKSNVLEYAAKYTTGDRKRRLLEKAEFFYDRCFQDLEAFETRTLTRPLVMMMTYGIIHSYFQSHPQTHTNSLSHDFDFGQPEIFLPQRTIAMMHAKRIIMAGASILVASILYLLINSLSD